METMRKNNYFATDLYTPRVGFGVKSTNEDVVLGFLELITTPG